MAEMIEVFQSGRGWIFECGLENGLSYTFSTACKSSAWDTRIRHWLGFGA